MKRILSLLAICSAALASIPAYAGNLVDLQVISRSTGARMTVYHAQGKSWVVGTPGERYSIQMRNLTGARVMGVLSVDGVNAITGETAAPLQTGYVLGPYQVAEITGWRKSNDEVARFYFTPLPDSYAARTDRPDNVGVIGLAVYREYVEPPVVYAPKLSQNQASRAAGAPAAPESDASSVGKDLGRLEKRAEDKLGTGHGEREYSSISRTEFRRASSTPSEIIAVRYDSRERLASAGILPRHVPYGNQPQPFPGQFVPDPGFLSYRTHE